MNNLKIGDEVECLEWDTPTFIKGNIYKVTRVNENSISVYSHLGRSWTISIKNFNESFKLVEEKNNLQKEIDELNTMGYRDSCTNKPVKTQIERLNEILNILALDIVPSPRPIAPGFYLDEEQT